MTGEQRDVVVIGGGAAGLMAGIEAARQGRRVTVLEHNEQAGRKILISGGGRCNFTNTGIRPECFLSENPRFIRSALSRFTAEDFIARVNRHGIAWHEKKLGQLFCDGSSRQIVDLLLGDLAGAGGELLTGVSVREVVKESRFTISTGGRAFEADSLVVATGGLSIPKMGATDFAHRLARQFGLRVVPPRPALVPLTLEPEDLKRYGKLAGVSLETVARSGNGAFRENLLFTHRGLSGPAVLQISSYWRPGETIAFDLLPTSPDDGLSDGNAGGQKLANALARHLPRRFVDAWLPTARAETVVARLRKEDRAWLEQNLHHWTIRPAGTEGYAKAEVTAGGVDTRDLSSRTLEARTVPGLYFIGEAVDVTGWLGGYNFQWAWSSGWAAGQSA